jgi:hypothetical protein
MVISLSAGLLSSLLQEARPAAAKATKSNFFIRLIFYYLDGV